MRDTDIAMRQLALDSNQSFIVQAPAGSGKTSLLVARYLTLLANNVEHPEEILAITFTRKAAAEMQQRILSALTENSNDEKLSALVQKVLAKDKHYGWNLLNNPKRLKILTIDSFCAWLANAVPEKDEFNLNNAASPFVQHYYEKACDQLLELEQNNSELLQAFNLLLKHFNNDYINLRAQLSELLAKRDQWLPHLLSDNTENLRKQIEKSFQNLIEDHLQEICDLTCRLNFEELYRLMRYASSQLEIKNKKFLAYFSEIKQPDFFAPDIQQLNLWKAVAHFLLTESNTLRKEKGINKTCGFPSDAPEQKLMKKRMTTFLSQLNSDRILESLLATIKVLPKPELAENQWQILKALAQVLPWLCAQLRVFFAENGICDFTENSLKALAALTENGLPTNLAFYLEHKIQHILVDEFQDTSLTQYHLLEKLTQAWEPGDGHSLFLVGDPMQSIYGFREAEVGLFLKAANEGINQISLKKITLSNNFRADRKLVDWTNQLFKKIMPPEENMEYGAIPFSEAVANKNFEAAEITYQTADYVGRQIGLIIQQALKIKPDAKIAVLVRNRSHLLEIREDLRLAGIDYTAIEMEALADLIIIQDLMTITRALLNLTDRIAWLALLRAPWCGLTLNDLVILSSDPDYFLIWQAIENHEKITGLSLDALQRLNNIYSIISYALATIERAPLSELVKRVWYQLDGPALIKNKSDLIYAEDYFNLLDQLNTQYKIIDAELINEYLARLYASDFKNTQIEIMTIHKAKGLEFDCVILPLLENRPQNDSNPLLYWWLRPRQGHADELLLAPVKSYEDESDQHHQYLRYIETKKTELETARLLYVAVTRAKQSLHLVSGPYKSVKSQKTITGLLLNLFEDKFEFANKDEIIKENQSSIVYQNNLIRIKHANTTIAPLTILPVNSTTIELNDNQEDEKTLGIVIHQMLYDLSQLSTEQWPDKYDENWLNYYYRQLKQQNYAISKFAAAKSILQKTGLNLSESPRARWILSPHPDAASELTLSYKEEQQIKKIIIDRTFYADGFQWIIDYKTTAAPPDELDKFYRHQIMLHRNQLETYTKVIDAIYKRPIRCALYFPLFDGWVEIETQQSVTEVSEIA